MTKETSKKLDDSFYSKLKTIDDINNSNFDEKTVLSIDGDKLPPEIAIAFINKYGKILTKRAKTAEQLTAELEKLI